MSYSVKLISLDFPDNDWVEAKIEINHHQYNTFAYLPSKPKLGSIITVDVDYLDCEEESFEDIFSGNPHQKKELIHIKGFRYKAFGEIVSIKPIIVDVGDFELEMAPISNDQRIIGEFIAFSISRLDAIESEII